MAEETQVAEASPPSKGGSTLKAILVIAAVLLIEAGTILGTIMLSGGPTEVKGEGIAADVLADQNKLVEVQVVAGKFDNQRTGRTYLYDTEVFVTVRQKHLEKFKEELESMKTQISVDVQTIFRRADPAHFQEPTRATLTRQINAALDQRFGETPEGEPYIESVLIGKCLPYRADY
jgi:flagellar basal body-associated protein FliL